MIPRILIKETTDIVNKQYPVRTSKSFFICGKKLDLCFLLFKYVLSSGFGFEKMH
jgi:hypothetical protein